MKKLVVTVACIVAITCCVFALNACACKHNKTEWKVVTEPTCIAEGRRVLYCTKCGEEFDSEAISKLPHTEADIAPVAATCQSEGFTGGKYCVVCSTTTRTPQRVPKLRHIDVNLDCICDDCEESVHSYTAWEDVKAATCSAKGTRRHVCEVCGKEETEEIDTIPHVTESIVAVGATCTASGMNAGNVCKVCGSGSEDIYVEALGHDFVDGACSRCGKIDNYCRTLIYRYEEADKSYRVMGFASDAPACDTLVIPSYYNGKLVKRIHIGAFENSGITHVEIPFSIEEIYEEAFRDCTQLTSVTFEENSRLNRLRDGVFGGCALLAAFDVPENVNIIEKDCFEGCTSLTSFNVPVGVANIHDGVFRDARITEFTVDENNIYYKAEGGNLFTKDGKTLLAYAVGKTDTSYVIPAKVEILAEYAFYGAANLTEISVAENSKLYSICNYAFSDTLIASFVIPSTVFEIGDSAFEGCADLVTVTFADGSICAYIGDYAFKNCTTLSDLNLPKDTLVYTLDTWFEGCTSLEID